MNHPGWKACGIVLSTDKSKFLLLDNGTFDSTTNVWVFKALRLNYHTGILESLDEWHIIPQLYDIYEAR